MWTHRIMLESLEHSHASFLTLTYADQNLVRVPGKDLATLSPEHLRNWLKRLRFKLQPQKIRFYAVGEYGDQSQRPHYHAVIFGLPPCSYGMTRKLKHSVGKSCCSTCDLVRDTWMLGNIYVGEVNLQTAQYVAGYTVKKMTCADDLRLEGRYPEFARMSLKPGIGAGMMHEVASALLEHDDQLEDVPTVLRHGMKQMPLGRYLRKKLRAAMGREVTTPASVLEKRSEEMRPLREYAFIHSKALKAVIGEFYFGETQRQELLAQRFKGKRTI